MRIEHCEACGKQGATQHQIDLEGTEMTALCPTCWMLLTGEVDIFVADWLHDRRKEYIDGEPID